MTSVRYARVKSTITDDNSDDNVNQLQTIDSEEEEEDVSTPIKILSKDDSSSQVKIKQSLFLNSTLITTALLILCYFVLSIGLTFYQRWLLKVLWREELSVLFSFY